MKKLLWLLVALTLFLPLTASAQGGLYNFTQAVPDSATDLPQEQAVQIATELMDKHPEVMQKINGTVDTYSFPEIESSGPLVIISHFVTLSNLEPLQKAWILSFFDGDDAGAACSCVGSAVIASPSGNVLASAVGNLQTIFKLWQPEKGSYYTWSAEDQYWFDLLYEPQDTGFLAAIPKADELPQAKAREIAVQALADQQYLSVDNLTANYTILTKFCVQDPQNPSDRVWLVGFMEEDAAPENFNFRYHVLINAKDGAVLEVLDYTNGLG